MFGVTNFMPNVFYMHHDFFQHIYGLGKHRDSIASGNSSGSNCVAVPTWSPEYVLQSSIPPPKIAIKGKWNNESGSYQLGHEVIKWLQGMHCHTIVTFLYQKVNLDFS